MTTMIELEQLIRDLPSKLEKAAVPAAQEIRGIVQRNVSAQVDTTGRPWEARNYISKKTPRGKPMLQGAADALQVVVRGSTIYLSLPWEPYGRQSKGAIKNGPQQQNRKHTKHAEKRWIRREILPNPSFLPPEWRKAIERHIQEAASGAD